MQSHQFLLLLTLIPQILGMSLPTASPGDELPWMEIHNPDPHFSLNLGNLEGMEISQSLQTISGAVMGTAELALGIKSDLKLLRKEIMMSKMNMRFEGRHHHPDSNLQNIFAQNSTSSQNATEPASDQSEEQVQKTITTNFIRILSAMLINGPPSTQRRKDDILKLMRKVLNGDLNYGAVLEKLPFILKESETNQFIILIQTIKEDEFPKIKTKTTGRQGEDEDEDGEDEVATAAPVAAPIAAAPAPAEFQETVIFLPRPQQQGPQQGSSSTATQAQGGGGVSISSGSGAVTVGRPPVNIPNKTKPGSGTATATATQQTQAPLRIVVRQPQPKPAPTPPTTAKPRTQFQKITDAVGSLDVNQFQGLIDSLPDLFAGIDGLVDGVESIIGDQPAQ